MNKLMILYTLINGFVTATCSREFPIRTKANELVAPNDPAVLTRSQRDEYYSCPKESCMEYLEKSKISDLFKDLGGVVKNFIEQYKETNFHPKIRAQLDPIIEGLRIDDIVLEHLRYHTLIMLSDGLYSFESYIYKCPKHFKVGWWEYVGQTDYPSDYENVKAIIGNITSIIQSFDWEKLKGLVREFDTALGKLYTVTSELLSLSCKECSLTPVCFDCFRDFFKIISNKKTISNEENIVNAIDDLHNALLFLDNKTGRNIFKTNQELEQKVEERRDNLQFFLDVFQAFTQAISAYLDLYSIKRVKLY